MEERSKNWSTTDVQHLETIIKMLELDETQKQFMKVRWLTQVRHLETRADSNRRIWATLRLTTIIGGAIIPVLVSLNISGVGENSNLKELIHWLAFFISLLVALTAAIEGFARSGDRWRLYYLTANQLKSEGWLYIQRTGIYRQYKHLKDGYPRFAERVELILQERTDRYIDVMREKQVEAHTEAPPNTKTSTEPTDHTSSG